MRLFELPKLPVEAGEATIKWRDGNIDNVVRRGKSLSLIDTEDAEFFPLLGGRQFLYMVRGAFFFGGTDENSFLVRLDSRGFRLSSLRKEEDFLSWLKPNLVKDLESRWQTQAVRQGDWFAVKSPESYKSVKRAIKVLYGSGQYIEEIVNLSVGGTRHKFTGTVLKIPKGNLYCGVLSAPDHQPKDISDGLYALVQCDKLYNAVAAD